MQEKFYCCLSILSVKLNILNSEPMCVLPFDLGECIQLLSVRKEPVCYSYREEAACLEGLDVYYGK
jgi:hypothetical protein